MADRMLPFGQVTPTARPIGAFVQAAQQDTPGPARPVELPAARGIDTLQQSGTTNVQGFNQFQQLAAALAPFSSALMKTAETGYESYAKGKIEEGYYRARNQYARAQLSLQVQAETGAADAASTIGQLQKRDPEAAQLLKESNPWALIGQRRAVAQLVAADVENALEDDLVNSAGLLAQMKPGSPALKARQVQLTSQALGRYGLTGDELEVNFYVTPRVNKASEQYTDKQRKFYNKAVEDSTTSAATAALGATVDQILKNDAVVDGVTYKRGTAEWREYGAAVLTQGLDQQLRLLDPEARARAIQYIRAQVGGTYGNAGPFAAGLLQSIRGGDPSMPYEKRPTWGAMAPLEMQELQVRGMKATQEQHDLQQKTVENQLNTAWYGTPEKKGPGSLDPNDPGYPAALVAFRNMALGMGYLNPEEYIARRANDQSRYVQVVRPPDPFLAENFAVEIGMVPPSAWTDDPNAYANALRQAQQIANQEPTPEGKRETYRRLVGEIDKARSSAADFDAGVRDRVQQEVLQDLDSDAVRQIRNEQKVGGKQGSALDQMLASRMGSGASVSTAVASTYQNAKLTAAANRLTALYERELSKGIRDWKAENPGRQLSPAQRSVEMSEAAARARKSPQYVQIIKELTGRQPGELGPRKVGTNPRDARGVPREGARKLSDDTIRTYQSRPVMEPRWVYGELQQLQRGKPVSPELYNMARRANTTTFNYLLEQLKMYPTLDPKGEAKRWLEEKSRQQRPARTVAGNQVSSVVRDGLGGWNPLAAGGWLMSMIAPPAAAATLPPSFMGGAERFPAGSPGQFEKPESVVYERPGRGNQPGVDYWFPSKQFPAVLTGRVKDVGREPGYGNYVVVESTDPRNGQKVDVLYGHLPDGGVYVRRGQTINAGQLIGKQGGTGNVRSADGTIASVDFFAPRPAGSRDMTPYQDFDGLRRFVTSRMVSGGRSTSSSTQISMATPTTRRGGGLTGIATYYNGSGGSDGVAGGPTANGEIYDPNKMTAAVQWSQRGKYLNKWVTVEDLDTGRSVRVWVNDVGQMGGTEQSINRTDPRVIDLSPAAFRKLFGSTQRGTGRIRIKGVK
jgi:hypothetical protein